MALNPHRLKFRRECGGEVVACWGRRVPREYVQVIYLGAALGATDVRAPDWALKEKDGSIFSMSLPKEYMDRGTVDYGELIQVINGALIRGYASTVAREWPVGSIATLVGSPLIQNSDLTVETMVVWEEEPVYASEAL